MQLASRLWQRASAVTWYKRHAALFPTGMVDFTTPAPVEVVETIPAQLEPAVAASPQENPLPDVSPEDNVPRTGETSA